MPLGFEGEANVALFKRGIQEEKGGLVFNYKKVCSLRYIIIYCISCFGFVFCVLIKEEPRFCFHPQFKKWQLLPFCSSVYICPFFICLFLFVWGVNPFSKTLKVLKKNYCNYISTTCLLSTIVFQKYCFVQTLFLAFLKFGVKFEDGLHCVFGTYKWKNATGITTWGKIVATKIIGFDLLESSNYKTLMSYVWHLWNIIYCTI